MDHTDDVKNTSEIVHSALTLIIELCQSIMNANICMNDLIKYQSGIKSSPLQDLCFAVNSGKVCLCPKFSDVDSAMALCAKKFDFVQEYNKKIEVVVKHCSKISQGILFI